MVAAVFFVWNEPCPWPRTIERNAPSAESWNSYASAPFTGPQVKAPTNPASESLAGACNAGAASWADVCFFTAAPEPTAALRTSAAARTPVMRRLLEARGHTPPTIACRLRSHTGRRSRTGLNLALGEHYRRQRAEREKRAERDCGAAKVTAAGDQVQAIRPDGERCDQERRYDSCAQPGPEEESELYIPHPHPARVDECQNQQDATRAGRRNDPFRRACRIGGDACRQHDERGRDNDGVGQDPPLEVDHRQR